MELPRTDRTLSHRSDSLTHFYWKSDSLAQIGLSRTDQTHSHIFIENRTLLHILDSLAQIGLSCTFSLEIGLSHWKLASLAPRTLWQICRIQSGTSISVRESKIWPLLHRLDSLVARESKNQTLLHTASATYSRDWLLVIDCVTTFDSASWWKLSSNIGACSNDLDYDSQEESSI